MAKRKQNLERCEFFYGRCCICGEILLEYGKNLEPVKPDSPDTRNRACWTCYQKYVLVALWQGEIEEWEQELWELEEKEKEAKRRVRELKTAIRRTEKKFGGTGLENRKENPSL